MNNNTITPVNYRERETSGEALLKDIQYAVLIGEGYIKQAKDRGLSVSGNITMELGPGINFGASLVLAGNGSTPFVADRFLAPWNDLYHPKFYSMFAMWAKENRPLWDPAPFVIAAESESGLKSIVRTIDLKAEYVDDGIGCNIDYTFSNAVLEHVADINKTANSLFQITKAGGYGFHQIDLRYHTDFSRPLDYLLMSEERFDKVFTSSNGECGSQRRRADYEKAFMEAGFTVCLSDVNMRAEEKYLVEIMDKLGESEDSIKYRSLSRETLSEISCFLVVCK